MAAATGDKQKFGVLKFIFFMHPLPFGIELCKVLVKFLKKQGLSFANAGSWQLTFFVYSMLFQATIPNSMNSITIMLVPCNYIHAPPPGI